MKYVLLAITFIFLPLMNVFAEVSKFVFVSPSSFPVSERQTITLQSQNSSNEKENVTQTTCVEVRTTSPSGKLFASANSTDPVSVLVLTMSKNSANRNFYYEDVQAGSYLFKAKAAYRPEEEKRTCQNWPVEEWGNTWIVEQSYSVGSGTSNSIPPENSNSQNTTTATANTSQSTQIASSFPVDPQVFADINLSSKTIIAGAQFFISGEGYGIEKKPLANARFVWNFGDGIVKSGKAVAHTYRNPGEYVIVLDVSSEKFAGTDREIVTVIPSPLHVSVKQGQGGNIVHITNGSNTELDLSGWMLDISGTLFVIPLHTVVLPQKVIMFDSVALGVHSISQVSLLYPNGSVAHAVHFSQDEVVSVPVLVRANPVPQASAVVQQNKRVAVSNKNDDAQVSNAVSATFEDKESGADQDSESSQGSLWWVIGFIGLLIIAVSSVFLIKRPVYNQGNDFIIKE